MLAVNELHAAVFGRHYHPCPSERCNNKERPCSEEYDCQPGEKLCYTCQVLEGDGFDLPEKERDDFTP